MLAAPPRGTWSSHPFARRGTAPGPGTPGPGSRTVGAVGQCGVMTDLVEPKPVLKHYLQQAGDALLWKLEGRRARHPVAAHADRHEPARHRQTCAEREVDLLRRHLRPAWPTPEELVSPTRRRRADGGLVRQRRRNAAGSSELYRRVRCSPTRPSPRCRWTLPVGPGRSPGRRRSPSRDHGPRDRRPARHAGHADILREQIDGAVGLAAGRTNISRTDWQPYVTKLSDLAERFPPIA